MLEVYGAERLKLHQELIDGLKAKGHPVHESVLGVDCVVCGNLAMHKLGEELGPPSRHNLTAYVCCEEFSKIMGGFYPHCHPAPLIHRKPRSRPIRDRKDDDTPTLVEKWRAEQQATWREQGLL